MSEQTDAPTLDELIGRLTPRILGSLLQPVRPPAPRMCAECPWRASVQAQGNPDGWHEPAVYRRYWATVQDGGTSTCHMTEPAYEPSPAAVAQGLRCTPETARHRECAGTTLLIRRELAIAGSFDSSEDYRTFRRGLALDGDALAAAAARPELATDADLAPPSWLPERP